MLVIINQIKLIEAGWLSSQLEPIKNPLIIKIKEFTSNKFRIKNE